MIYKRTFRDEVPEDGATYRISVECPVCGEDYYEVVRYWPATYSTPGDSDVIEEGTDCPHVVDVEEQLVTFARFPRLYARASGLFARFRRSTGGILLRRLRRKLLG